MKSYIGTFRNKRVLITGGLGFIGSTIARRMVEMGAKVILIDSMLPHYGGNLFNIKGIEDKVTVNIADVRDQYSMYYLVKGQDYIFNMAGTLSHIDSMEDPYTDLEINCRAQLSVLEACRKNNPDVKIVFAGTRGQYGRAEYLPVNEKHPLNPIDVNGINNIAGELYHILYNNIYGIRATSLRLTNTYGPRHQMKHSRQGFLNWFIRLALDGQKINIYGSGEQKRDSNYVDDVVEALIMAAASDKTNGQVYNLGSSRPMSVLEVARLIVRIIKKGSVEFVPFPKKNKKIEVGDYYADYNKIKKALGWKPAVDMEEGISKTVDYYKKYKKYYW